jgi:Predicted membrane protein/domain
MEMNEYNIDENGAFIEDNINKLNYAKFMKRVFAYIIDNLVLGTIGLIEFAIMYRFLKYQVTHTQLLMIDVNIVTLTNILYFSIMESSSKKATIGKKAIGIFVTDLEGNKITFLKAIIRNCVKLIASIIVFLNSLVYPTNILYGKTYIQMLGYLFALFLPRKQALHDLITGTVVLSK